MIVKEPAFWMRYLHLNKAVHVGAMYAKSVNSGVSVPRMQFGFLIFLLLTSALKTTGNGSTKRKKEEGFMCSLAWWHRFVFCMCVIIARMEAVAFATNNWVLFALCEAMDYRRKSTE